MTMTNVTPLRSNVIPFPLQERMSDTRERPDRLAIIEILPSVSIERYQRLCELAPFRVHIVSAYRP